MADIDKALPNTRTKLEVPGPEQEVDVAEQEQEKGPVEVTPEEDGGATIDFDPSAVNQASTENHFDNLADILPEETLDPIGSKLRNDYKDYKASRKDWERSYINGLDLLGFKYDNRNEPFQGASGATHPVLAEAVTQFQALAYKELLPSDGPVRTQMLGVSNPAKEQQAQRVKDFMNYQILDQMKEYEPEFDQMLFHLPLAGSTFKKVYYDDLLGRAVSKFIPADDLVVPYTATSLDDAESVIHVIKISENDLRKQQVNGFYTDIELSKPSDVSDADKVTDKERELEGIAKTSKAENLYTLLECHVNLDLEGFEDVGEDGEPTEIKLPYVVTIEEGSQKVLSVRRNYAPNDPLKKFKDVDTPGGNLKDAFVFLPYKEPSATLLQLMGIVVQAGQRFASIADMQVGDGNQQAAVGTTVALLERGSRVMSAIHKRLYVGLKSEFKLLAKVFATYLPPEYPYDVVGGQKNIKVADFDDRVDVLPVADPNIFSMSQRISLAQTGLQLAMASPQIHNLYNAYRKMYEALGIKDIDRILPPPPPTAPKDPSLEHIDALAGKKFQAFPGQDHRAHVTAHLNFMSTNLVRNNPNVMAAIQKNILEHISLMATEQVQLEYREQMVQLQQLAQQAAVNPQAQQQVAEMTQNIEARKAVLIAEMTGDFMKEEKEITSQFDSDPLLKLKSREVDLKAMEAQRKQEETTADQQLERAKLLQAQQLNQQKMEQNEELAELRADTSLEKQEIANDARFALENMKPNR
jgi:hypothetical protein